MRWAVFYFSTEKFMRCPYWQVAHMMPLLFGRGQRFEDMHPKHLKYMETKVHHNMTRMPEPCVHR